MPNVTETTSVSVRKLLEAKDHENAVLKAKVASLAKFSQDLEKHNRYLKQKREGLKKINEDLARELTALKSDHRDVEERNFDIEGKMANMEQELEDQKDIIRSMEMALEDSVQTRYSPPMPLQFNPAQGKRSPAASPDPRPSKRYKLNEAREDGEIEDDTPWATMWPSCHRPTSSSTGYIAQKWTSGPSATSESDALNLPPADIQIYLRDATNFNISPPPLDISVPHHTLCQAYLDVVHSFKNQIPAAKNPTGDRPRTILFIRGTDHPLTPRKPGANGLVLGFDESEGSITEDGPCSLFRRIGKRKWLYLGEYENAYVESLSKEQFGAQTEPAQKRWAATQNRLSPRGTHDATRARFALRKEIGCGKELSPASIAERVLVESKRYPSMKPKVPESEILEAYRKGYEKISVIRMQCVGYDHAFMRDIEQTCVTGKNNQKKQKQEPEWTKIAPLPPVLLAAYRPTTTHSPPATPSYLLRSQAKASQSIPPPRPTPAVPAHSVPRGDTARMPLRSNLVAHSEQSTSSGSRPALTPSAIAHTKSLLSLSSAPRATGSWDAMTRSWCSGDSSETLTNTRATTLMKQSEVAPAGSRERVATVDEPIGLWGCHAGRSTEDIAFFSNVPKAPALRRTKVPTDVQTHQSIQTPPSMEGILPPIPQIATTSSSPSASVPQSQHAPGRMGAGSIQMLSQTEPCSRRALRSSPSRDVVEPLPFMASTDDFEDGMTDDGYGWYS